MSSENKIPESNTEPTNNTNNINNINNINNTNDINNINPINSLDKKKQLSYFELILKYKNKININYNDYDFQKGENSPRMLFKKRRMETNNNIDNTNINFGSVFSNNNSQNNLINEDKSKIFLLM
jgi:hypothetical protein